MVAFARVVFVVGSAADAAGDIACGDAVAVFVSDMGVDAGVAVGFSDMVVYVADMIVPFFAVCEGAAAVWIVVVVDSELDLLMFLVYLN